MEILLKKALARASVLTVLAYIISGVLFWIFKKFDFSGIVLGVLVCFNLVFMTFQFRRAINPSSFFDLDASFKSKIISQYILNILIFIIFILRS
ncbi:hypothetical protein [Algoriphagus algorifonticola]|uniref:hypothetical protein n=1 Tax=Algoriphagus algorifonticola TaxID=2593007 RepID=UPI0011A9F393|nr:hypothetical protein [Algoriphagus algorifonticola]